jgi:hypothetical protein
VRPDEACRVRGARRRLQLPRFGSELAAIRGRREAERILTDLLEEIQQLPDALAAAIASQHAD